MGLQEPTDFVCYCQAKDSACSIGHFRAARATAESGEVEIMDDSGERSIFIDIPEFRDLCRKYATYLFQPDASMPSSSSTDRWSYEVRDGAKSECWPAIETSLTSCVDCGNNMRKTERKRASVYGFYPTRNVWRGRRKCSSLKCNARHWFNYRSRSQKKIFFEERDRDGIVFVNSSVDFYFAFIEYIQKLHFFGPPPSLLGPNRTQRYSGRLARIASGVAFRALPSCYTMYRSTPPRE